MVVAQIACDLATTAKEKQAKCNMAFKLFSALVKTSCDVALAQICDDEIARVVGGRTELARVSR